jgi:hypothetical protein
MVQLDVPFAALVIVTLEGAQPTVRPAGVEVVVMVIV